MKRNLTHRCIDCGAPRKALRGAIFCLFVSINVATLSAENSDVISSDEHVISDIRSQPLQSLMISKKRMVPARVVSQNDAVIKSELNAVVESVEVAVGQRVAAGDLLIRLNCRDYDLSLELARADLSASEAELKFGKLQFQRAMDLKKKGLASDQEFDEREVNLAARRAGLDRARVQVQQARRNVERCNLRAAFSGVVVEKHASIGELLAPGAPILRLVDTDSIELSATVSPSYLEELQNQKSFTFLYGDGYRVELLRVGGAIDETNRSVESRFSFAGKKPIPGASAKLLWSTEKAFLPARYVSKYEGRDGIFLLVNNRVKFHEIPNHSPGLPVYLDLPVQTQIIVGRRAKLRDGMIVKNDAA